MIRYDVELVFEHLEPTKMGGIYKKNRSLLPKRNRTTIRYEIVASSLKDALEKLKPRMKDTKKYKFIKWQGGNRKKI